MDRFRFVPLEMDAELELDVEGVNEAVGVGFDSEPRDSRNWV